MSNINVNLNEVFDKIFNDKDLMSSIIDNAMEKELNKQNIINQLVDDIIRYRTEEDEDYKEDPSEWFHNSQDFLYSHERTDLQDRIRDIHSKGDYFEFIDKLYNEVRKERIKVINETTDLSLLINNDDYNPLHLINDESLVDLLIEKGFDVNANNNRMCNSLEERLFDLDNKPITAYDTEEEKRMIMKLIDSGVDYSRVIKHLPDEIKEHIKMKEIKDEQKALSEIRNENNEPKRKPRI
ncbi:hypothetical protein ACTM3P_24600 [Citrobacter freundii]|uniref:hypothetical protein n=1 Tax=Citrobacter freundii TaxID=546 RepID=UPI001076F296|nr:hypothetical protein [Salmonella enterica subsp. enterica serovar Infantis]EAP0773974.1 hypothetical protein [Salmonella enterica]EDN0389090.1 hypothetical protein [Salmonella enterica subsp. enterica serovar Newport]EAB9059962.1 hypothetical protein [Salmonella enterica subsp. enterica serovar Infantis]EAP8967458.1 hypothetical protein [Salmonella enterica]